MKKLNKCLILAISVFMAMPLMAQNSKQSKDRIAYIRKIYQEAQEHAKRSADNMVTTTLRDKTDGVASMQTLDFFYLTDVVEVVEIPYCKLNLLRRTLKGGTNSYEEFLYDPKDESLIFYFYTAEQEKGVKCETRWYDRAADDGTALKLTKFIDTKTGKDVSNRYGDMLGMPWDDGFLNRFAHDMQEAFNHITLRGWD
jgi:hypothetical protein